MTKKIAIGLAILIGVSVISSAAFVVIKNQKSRARLKQVTDQVSTDLPTDQTKIPQAASNPEPSATTTPSAQTPSTPKTTKKTTNQTAETTTASTEIAQDTSTTSKTSSDSSHPSSDSSSPSSSSSDPVIWQYDGSKWQPSATPPTCGNTISLGMPVDLSLVTSILYPGQTRGGDYKAHGGFRFDNSANDAVTVRAPYDAVIVDGVRYYENNVLQYMFDFQVSCGIAFRLDHLETLSSALQTVADGLPEPKVDDTRTTTISPPVAVTKNQTLATAVGQTSNTFVDWGVYDLRQTNGISKSNNSLASYAVCWFDWLSSADAATVRGLPATAGNKTSDYCK